MVIPSFAVERSQELLHDIAVLLDAGEIPNATVYLDSPLARKATEVFIKYASEMEDIEIDESKIFRHPNFRLVESVEESIAINHVKKGAIIISASGMCTAGRIKHHLKNNIYRPESTILFVGYQAPGTLGNIITSGAKRVRIHGKEYKVRAQIRTLGNYSAHADQVELINWILERGPILGGLFLNHGEDDARTCPGRPARREGNRPRENLPADLRRELRAGRRKPGAVGGKAGAPHRPDATATRLAQRLCRIHAPLEWQSAGDRIAAAAARTHSTPCRRVGVIGARYPLEQGLANRGWISPSPRPSVYPHRFDTEGITEGKPKPPVPLPEAARAGMRVRDLCRHQCSVAIDS